MDIFDENCHSKKSLYIICLVVVGFGGWIYSQAHVNSQGIEHNKSLIQNGVLRSQLMNQSLQYIRKDIARLTEMASKALLYQEKRQRETPHE